MKTDYIDLFYLHRYDSFTPVEETLQMVSKLLSDGKILYWGISGFSTLELCEIYYTALLNNIVPPVAAQYPFNLMNQDVANDQLLALQKFGIGMIGYYPLAQGVLTGKYTDLTPKSGRGSNPTSRSRMWNFTEANITRVNEFVSLAKPSGYTPATLALAWCLRQQGVCSVSTNVSSEDQLNEALKLNSVNLTERKWRNVDALF